jgi:O-antigen/teichoic acid export membrane protein
MNAPLTRNATAEAEPTRPGGEPEASNWDWRTVLAHRRTIVDYLQVLGGASGRVALQTVYFLILANTLNLREMGIFASVSAAGMIIGSFTAFGFQGQLFRTAAARPRSLGGAFAAYYAAFAVSLPIGAAAAGALYWLLFAPSIGPAGYFTIIAAEISLWRFVEMLVQVNNGLGRYSAAAHVLMASAALRALAALAFLAVGGGDAAHWSAFYFAGNAAAFATLGYFYHPRVRLRWKPAIFFGRLCDGFAYAVSYCAFLAQNEADKLVILSLAGDRMAGIYVIAMRILDLTAAPLRPMFVIYSRKILLAGRARLRLLGEILRVEAFIAATSIAGYLALLALLSRWPNALGHNVASAYGLLSVLWIAPAAKNLIEFHGELFFTFGRMGARGVLSASMVALKAAAIALLIRAFAGDPHWTPWLNAIYAAIYLMSLATVRLLLSPERTA